MIPQAHSPVQHGGKVTEDVIKSQLKIAQFLATKGISTVVFNEDTFEDASAYTPEQLRAFVKKLDASTDVEPWIADTFKMCLRLSLQKNSNFADLSSAEKSLLGRLAATQILLWSGKLRQLHAVVNSLEQGDKLMEDTEALIQSYSREGKKMQLTDDDPLNLTMNIVREKLALNKVREFFAKNPKTTEAFIVFGSGHDFRQHQKDFPDFDIKIHPDFKDDTHFWADQLKN